MSERILMCGTPTETIVKERGGVDPMAMMAMMQNQKGGLDPTALMAMANNGGLGGGSNQWLWLLFIFLFMGNGSFGGLGRNGALPVENQINQDANTNLVMQAISGNKDAISSLATNLNCDFGRVEQTLCTIMGGIDKVAGDVRYSGSQVINAVQAGNASIASKLAECCCATQNAIQTQGCETRSLIQSMGYDNQIATINQTNSLQGTMNTMSRDSQSQFNILGAKIDAQTQIINQKFCDLQMREYESKIDSLRNENNKLFIAQSQANQNNYLVNQLKPSPSPAYIVGNPYCTCECNCGTTTA